MKHIYVVVERDPLVAIDLQEIIADYDDGASVRLVETLDDAVAILTTTLSTATVVVSSSADLVISSGLGDAVSSTQSRMIIIDQEVSAEPGSVLHCRYLKAPFTTESLTQALSTFSDVAQ
ncbi:hypothetical protein [Litoreibacter janthinus]|uniref:Response regulatory domain-containing protein n=1 Tax=Litoreibacter janthinus TaxID=670154 RepID=A0A1I6GBZ5_9RHOB|nr:hypothetical protein [Litoreibacter janthinus]SFR39706.1 hypothetical protein SAMN04488002_1217 [Litoreibacter janthinus]